MTSKGWLFGALVAGSAVFAVRGGCVSEASTPPDVKLAERFGDLCEIARGNIATPEKGVRKLGHYLHKHTGDMFGEWGSTLAVIEHIKDDDKHDDRARLARDRLAKPWRTCERDWMRFAEAVERDPAAAELVENFSIRFNRTLEIIFSGRELSLDLLRVPLALPRALDRLGAR